MIPLRAVCEAYGCIVEWDQYNKTATVYLNDDTKDFCLYTVGEEGVEGHDGDGDGQYVYVCCKPISIINNRIIVEMNSLPFIPIKDETDYSKNYIVFKSTNYN